MKKIFYLLVFSLLFTAACDGNASNARTELSPDKVYFFYSNSCPHCHDALEYINGKYPELKLSMVNIGNSEGYDLLIKCARDFRLGSRVGTPFFCMGSQYLMGWSPEIADRFDEKVKPFLN